MTSTQQELPLIITFLSMMAGDEAVTSSSAQSLELQPCKTTLGSGDTNALETEEEVFSGWFFCLCPYSSASSWLLPGYCQVFQTTIFNSLSPATLWLPWPATIMGLQGKAIVGTLGLSALWRTGLSPGCHSSHQPEPRESTICCKPIAAGWHLVGWERAPAWQGTITHHIKGRKGTGRREGKR